MLVFYLRVCCTLLIYCTYTIVLVNGVYYQPSHVSIRYPAAGSEGWTGPLRHLLVTCPFLLETAAAAISPALLCLPPQGKGPAINDSSVWNTSQFPWNSQQISTSQGNPVGDIFNCLASSLFTQLYCIHVWMYRNMLTSYPGYSYNEWNLRGNTAGILICDAGLLMMSCNDETFFLVRKRVLCAVLLTPQSLRETVAIQWTRKRQCSACPYGKYIWVKTKDSTVPIRGKVIH